MQVPIQTADIFKFLSKGQFINSNSSTKAVSDLYKVIEDEQTYPSDQPRIASGFLNA
ncbi:hypothetical protein C8N25_11159 [Algoriphagus antarcticus]|uniref:Uncharacterized protein n=1 Tax=Algoriphagus antarcticus TaxID=238540 RepID=A0A3E0DUF9_9BACT|nr:hypothetical protein C8N25_11159 [Algoriphagus antarcticus]